MSEEWRLLNITRDYYVTVDGRVRNWLGQPIKVTTNRKGVRRVRINYRGFQTTMLVDDLIADAFPGAVVPAPVATDGGEGGVE